jgi:molecular chaperone GrpE
MDRRVGIPVRLQNTPAGPEGREAEGNRVAPQPVEDSLAEARQAQEETRPAGATAAAGQDAPETDWRDIALRLQAEMENYRKRQQRLAQDQIRTERERLLGAFLETVDNLDRALSSPGDGHALRQGVQLTRRDALKLLGKEGVEPVEALNRSFDPAWHEAVATVEHRRANATPETVVQVLQPGYRLGDQLLRPAKVIVAV